MRPDSESVGTLIEKVNAMSLDELKGQLPWPRTPLRLLR
jgi:hypothetical protein